MHKGSCLCGAVTFEVNGPLPAPSACHCTQCRKHSGHFEASTDIPRSALTIQGSENITWYQSSKTVRRGFCATCGSSLFWDPIQKDWTAVAMGAFDKPTNTKIKMHIFTTDKGDYYEIVDGLPQIPDPRTTSPTTQIDSSLTDYTTSLSYEERINAHESALEFIKDLQIAGKEIHATKSKSTS